MATTGFWPVRGRLKDVLNYAENPDKTTPSNYLDDDLQRALRYVENDDKIDQQMFVSGINCSVSNAYNEMIAVKRKYGKFNGVAAYHGYQSFKEGEVTPDEAHEIGVETARKMWGDKYQVIVTTHLNASHLHNHFVINSISFRDGYKYRNKIGDHFELRKVSDRICDERGKSVLQDAPFYGSDKAYWVRKSGKIPYRDMLRMDVDEALSYTINPIDFQAYMQSLGYHFVRDFRYEHPSVIAPDWKKPIRIDSLGNSYAKSAILHRLENQHNNRHFMNFYTPRSYARRTPLIMIIRDYEKKYQQSFFVVIFDLIVTIAKLITGNNIQKYDYRPLSPELRAEILNCDRTLEEYHFIKDHFIENENDFVDCRREIEDLISKYEAERQHLRNLIRRAKSPEEDLRLKEQCKEITKKLTPLRNDLKICGRIEQKVPRLRYLIEQEKQLEQGRYKYKYYQQNKTKKRGIER